MKRGGGGSLGDGGYNKGKGSKKTTTDSSPPPPEGGETIIKIDDVKGSSKKRIKGDKKGYNPDLEKLSPHQLEHLYNKIVKTSKGVLWERIYNDMDPDDADYNNDELHCYLSATNVNKEENAKWDYPGNIRLGKRKQRNEGDLKYNPNTSWSAAQLVLFYHDRKPDLETYPNPKEWEASHLCNHPWCVNLDHLLWEHIKKNAGRKNCRTWITCPCPCNHSFNPCNHEPKCITMKACKCKFHTKII
jgi:hypothetical protein